MKRAHCRLGMRPLFYPGHFHKAERLSGSLFDLSWTCLNDVRAPVHFFASDRQGRRQCEDVAHREFVSEAAAESGMSVMTRIFVFSQLSLAFSCLAGNVYAPETLRRFR